MTATEQLHHGAGRYATLPQARRVRPLALIGPPGIGKSTIVARFKTVTRTLDLEEFYDQSTDYDGSIISPRYQYETRCDEALVREGPTLVGAGAYPGQRLRMLGFRVALLHMPQNGYEERRSARDRLNPEKRGQRKHRVMDWIRRFASYDLILSADNRDIDHIITLLLSEAS